MSSFEKVSAEASFSQAGSTLQIHQDYNFQKYQLAQLIGNFENYNPNIFEDLKLTYMNFYACLPII